MGNPPEEAVRQIAERVCRNAFWGATAPAVPSHLIVTLVVLLAFIPIVSNAAVYGQRDEQRSCEGVLHALLD